MRLLPILAICATLEVFGPGVAPAAEPAHLPVGPERTQQRGLPPIPQGRPRPVNPLATSRVLLEEGEAITSYDLDRSLTKLCRVGRFRQQREHLFVVRLGGILYGAVIGGYWGLYDPQNLAVLDLVYALRYQDTGRCEVYVVRHLGPA
jgi:hypothetical protein